MATEKPAKPPKTAKPAKDAAEGSAPAQRASTGLPPGYKPRLMRLYQEQIRPRLKEELGLRNLMEVPRLRKIVLNMGVGEGARDEKILQQAEQDLMAIAGLKPKRTRAKLSVAAFKVRKGMPVGCCVTLRGAYMYEFLERLICVAIPRIRDFRGLPARAFDGRGGYNFGIREHAIFTEVDTSKLTQSFGMNVTLVTDARRPEHCRALLKHLGLPLRES